MLLQYSQIIVPALPGKALKRLLPFRGDDGKEVTEAALDIFVVYPGTFLVLPIYGFGFYI